MKQPHLKSSITRQLTVSVLLIVAALVAAVILTVTYLLTRSYDRQIRVEVSRASASIRQSVYWFMDGAYNLTEEFAVNPSILTMDPEIIIPMFQSCVARNDYLELLYIQKPDGMQIARSDSMAPGSRAGRWWFEKIMGDTLPFVSKSYYSVKTKAPVVAIYIPMYRDNELVGIFGSDIKLGYIQQLIERVSDKSDGRYSFIIDGDGVVIAHPDSEYLKTLTNFKTLTRYVPKKTAGGGGVFDERGGVVEVEEPYEISEEYRDAVSSVMRGESGTVVVHHRGKVYYLNYAPVDLPGESDAWSVITLQDKDAAMSIVSTLVKQIIVTALIIAFIALLVFVVILREKIFRPVRALTAAAENISRGELDAEIPSLIGSGDEIDVMVGALNRMVTQLRVHSILQAQAQVVTAAKLQFGLFVSEAASVQQAFRMTAAALKYHYVNEEFNMRSAELKSTADFGSSLKITAVYANPAPVYALTYSKEVGWGEGVDNAHNNIVDHLIKDDGVVESDTYPHYSEVAALLSGKRVVFLDAPDIKVRKANFIDAKTKQMCIVSLTAMGKTYGYVIVESDDKQGFSVVREEGFLRQAADELAAWIFSNKSAPLTLKASGADSHEFG